MKVSVDFGGWTTMKAAIAIAGALVIGGAVGSAVAVGPTVSAPIKWQGGVAAMWDIFEGAFHATLYTVPAGKNLMVTDLMLSNLTNAPVAARVYAGVGTCATVLNANVKLANILLPANFTLVVPLQTGIGFTPGQVVCVGGSDGMSANARGYLFTAAPAS